MKSGMWGQKQKQDWRRWTWNRIADCIPKHRREGALIVYLAGADDAEAIEAERRGFHNLIAIESDKKIASNLRRRGRLTVLGDALSVLRDWPDDWPIDVLSLDFFGGVPRKIDLGYLLLRHPALRRSVIATNLLRGRDWIKDNPFAESKCHRGELFLLSTINFAMGAAGGFRADLGGGLAQVRALAPEDFAQVRRLLKPSFHSYTSTLNGRKRDFDSVVFDWNAREFFAEWYLVAHLDEMRTMARNLILRGVAPMQAERTIRDALCRCLDAYPYGLSRGKHKGQLAAVRAWATRRNMKVTP